MTLAFVSKGVLISRRPIHHGKRRHSVCSLAASKTTRSLVKLPTGVSMEVLSKLAEGSPKAEKAPLLLIHGSLHGAWCWEYFQSHFSSHGFDSYAVSLRGAGNTLVDPEEECLVRGKATLEEHLHDLDALLSELQLGQPVLVGHSSGGLYAQQWANRSPPGKFAGMVLLASKPPSGHNWLTWRTTLKIGLSAAWRLTMAFVQKTVATDVDICRQLFFSKKGTDYDEDLEGDARLLKYMEYFKDQSSLASDLKTTQVPLKHPGSLAGKTLVMGGADDYIVDTTAVKQTAEFYGGKEILVPNTPHDVMLCTSWRVVASHITDWLTERGF